MKGKTMAAYDFPRPTNPGITVEQSAGFQAPVHDLVSRQKSKLQCAYQTNIDAQNLE